jgi:hypothetical protein
LFIQVVAIGLRGQSGWGKEFSAADERQLSRNEDGVDGGVCALPHLMSPTSDALSNGVAACLDAQVIGKKADFVCDRTAGKAGGRPLAGCRLADDCPECGDHPDERVFRAG